MIISNTRRFVLAVAAIAGLIASRDSETLADDSTSVEMRVGDLVVEFAGNESSPKRLSGIQSLFHRSHAPRFDAFDPDAGGSSAGLNFEHIIAGHNQPSNRFSPRQGPYSLKRLGENTSVMLERKRDDSPWSVASTMQYTVVPPHYIDFEFRCVPNDASRFGPRRFAIFFWANYMNEVDDVAIHFRGVGRPGEKETWIDANAPRAHEDYLGGGTYRSIHAKPLEYDDDHNFKLNVWSYDWPRFTRPFYFGRAANGMVFQIMFDRMHSKRDEIRFSLFKFKVDKMRRRPAWDFQYVVHRADNNATYGYRGRLVWKPFVGYDDCSREYEAWRAGLE